jgi:hypothetical protein
VRFSRRIILPVMAVCLFVAGCGGGGGGGSPSDIPGVVVERAPGRNHVQGHIDYPGKHPPSGGNHNPTPLTCGFYDQQPPDEFAVHSLEHGAVWIAFGPSTSLSDVQTLKAFAKQDHVIVTPYAAMDAPITLVAWEHRLEVQSASDPRIAQFVHEFANGPQAPERGAACQGVGQPAA